MALDIMAGKAGRGLPSASADGADTALRVDRYGGLVVPAKPKYALADEGSYFVITNPTNGTGVAGIAATGAFSDAESLLLIRNTSTEAEGKRIYLDYIRLRVTAAGTNGTNHLYVMKLDKGATRYTSGGTAYTPVNVNTASSASFSGTFHFGALVTTAASSDARLVARGTLRETIVVANDEFTFDFGGDHAAVPRGAAAAADSTNFVYRTIGVAPVVLGPSDSLVLSLYAASQDGASSYEFECGMWQR